MSKRFEGSKRLENSFKSQKSKLFCTELSKDNEWSTKFLKEPNILASFLRQRSKQHNLSIIEDFQKFLLSMDNKICKQSGDNIIIKSQNLRKSMKINSVKPKREKLVKTSNENSILRVINPPKIHIGKVKITNS